MWLQSYKPGKKTWKIKYGSINKAINLQLQTAGKRHGRLCTQLSLTVMLKLLSFPKKKVEMLQRVFVFIKYYLTYKNIAKTENQSQDWEGSNFYMTLLLCTLHIANVLLENEIHRTTCTSIGLSYILITFFHIPLFIFPKLKNAGHRFYSRFALGSVIFQCLRGIPQVDYFERT